MNDEKTKMKKEQQKGKIEPIRYAVVSNKAFVLVYFRRLISIDAGNGKQHQSYQFDHFAVH